ncbi:uncharacterized protein Dyak_GE27380 [Drosophila yakuba]|uniref:Uncharacterized protein n=1 Tax=Drosophila yakuba TaxID=7245 RepID=A0A0R1DLH2_DROYA|nr:uncharacterized protein Dyak_GE27380 [Drosophila yakuba]
MRYHRRTIAQHWTPLNANCAGPGSLLGVLTSWLLTRASSPSPPLADCILGVTHIRREFEHWNNVCSNALEMLSNFSAQS